jgi:type II secretory pathway component HofQ
MGTPRHAIPHAGTAKVRRKIKAETQMSVEYLCEKKSDDDEYNEIWMALQREQSAFERILLNENKAFVMGRLFEAKYLTQKLRTEKDQQLNLVNEQLERQEKAEQVNAEEEEDAWAA